MLQLLGSGHHKLGALANALGPALHDGLLLGVEAHALFAVGVHVAKQALLPATKAVPGHGHRNRHVDAHHAHLHAAAEFAPCSKRLPWQTCAIYPQ